MLYFAMVSGAVAASAGNQFSFRIHISSSARHRNTLYTPSSARGTIIYTSVNAGLVSFTGVINSFYNSYIVPLSTRQLEIIYRLHTSSLFTTIINFYVYHCFGFLVPWCNQFTISSLLCQLNSV